MNHWSVGLGRGVTHPRDMKFLTSDLWSSYNSKATQIKEGIKQMSKRFGEQL